MTRHFVKPILLVALVLASTLAGIGYFQLVALGEVSNPVGTIEGTIDNSMMATNSAVVFIQDLRADVRTTKDKSLMSLKRITFNPRVLPVVVGTTIECPNNDNLTHNIFSPTKSAKPFNFGEYPPGSRKEIIASKVGVIPFLCNIHAEMGAFCVVCPNKYFATTDVNGKFKIDKVPAGDYKLTFWHEKLRPKTIDVKVTAGATETVNFGDLERCKYSVDLLK